MAKGKYCPKTGAYLKACREAKGMTQRVLAEMLREKHHTIISQFEGGNLKVPPRLYEEYAKALDVELFKFTRHMLIEYYPELFDILIMKLYVQPKGTGD